MKQIRLSGSGGQGVITAAIIFAEGAVKEGKEAVQSQSYGPEARGGASKAEVIISDRTIYHPKVTTPDIVLAMTQQAADKYYGDLHGDGILIVDEDLVPNVPDFPNVIKVPITRIAVEQVGKVLFANMVALGLLVKVSKLVSFDVIKETVANRVPPATIEKNTTALKLGFDAVK
uniref:2-oxoacid:acceptor oxidoreductase family protein n=1 Tax=Massilibacillus massiliensis TaxID=1806837 RepID=UPI000B21243D|nr:2-oxoacid:acceptor oxidoreductase family protein [Massilibacillus massiliensis]